MRERRRVRYSNNTNQVRYRKITQPNNPKTKFSPKKLIRPIIIGIVLVILGYSVIASSLFRIKNIQVAGNQTLSETTIRDQVTAIIGDSPISQNILFVSANNIESQLKKNNYQVSGVKIERLYFNTLKITITEQKPSILWRSGNTLSVFSSNGRAYSGEPSEELKISLPTVIDTSNLPVKTGEKALDEGFVNFVSQLHIQLPERGVKAKEYQVQETTTEMYVITQDGYKLRFDTTRSVEEQLTDLTAVLDDLKKQGKKPNEYIDLRINGKVFYK